MAEEEHHPGAAPTSAIQARFHRALRGILLTTDTDWGNEVRAAFRTNPDVKILSCTAQASTLMEALRVQSLDLVLVDNDLAGSETGLAIAEKMARTFPKVSVYLTTTSPSLAIHNEARVRGIQSVIGRPFEPAELVAVIASIIAQEQAVAARLQGGGPAATGAHAGARSPVVSPRLIAVAGGKGGTGKSNLAANLAVLVQTNPTARLQAAYVDAERGEGAGPLLLGGLQKSPTLEDWLAYIGEADTAVDPGTVASRLVAEHETGLHCVFTTDSYHDYDALDGHVLTVLFNTLRLTHAVTVVDCPPTPTLPSLEAMSQATAIVAVTDLDLAGLAATQRYLKEIAADGIETSKVVVVANRVSAHPTPTVEEASTVLIDWGGISPVLLPEDPAVQAARGVMKPVATAYPDSPWVRALHRLAVELLPGMGLEFGASAAGRRGSAIPTRPAGGPRRRFLGLF